MNFDFKGIQKISTNMMNEFRLIPGSVVELAMPAAQLQMVTSYIRNIPSPLPFGGAYYAATIWWNLKLCFSPGGVYHGPCLRAKRSSFAQLIFVQSFSSDWMKICTNNYCAVFNWTWIEIQTIACRAWNLQLEYMLDQQNHFCSSKLLEQTTWNVFCGARMNVMFSTTKKSRHAPRCTNV